MRSQLIGSVPLALAFLSQIALGQTYVDPQGGSDLTGDGSQANPFATLTHAVSVAPSGGDEIVLFDTSGGRAVASEASGETFPIVLSDNFHVRGEKLGAALVESTVPTTNSLFLFQGGTDTASAYTLTMSDLELSAPLDAVEFTPQVPATAGPLSGDVMICNRMRFRVGTGSAIDADFGARLGAIQANDCFFGGAPSGMSDALVSIEADTIHGGGAAFPAGFSAFAANRCTFQDAVAALSVQSDSGQVLWSFLNCVVEYMLWGVDLNYASLPYDQIGTLAHSTFRGLSIGVRYGGVSLPNVKALCESNLFAFNTVHMTTPTIPAAASTDNYHDGGLGGAAGFQLDANLGSYFAGRTPMLLTSAPILKTVTPGFVLDDLYGRTPAPGMLDPGPVYHFAADQLVTRDPRVGGAVDLSLHGPAGHNWFLMVGTDLIPGALPFQLQLVPLEFPALGVVDGTGFAEAASVAVIPNQPAFYATPLYWQVGFQDPQTGNVTFTHSPISTDAGSVGM